MGQHFLISDKIAARAVKAANISQKDTVLEIGPGLGFLTGHLVKTKAKIIAVEKDEKLAERLKIKFAKTKNLKIITGDILKIENLPISQASCKLFENYGLKIKNYKVVANIPYYITSRLIKNFFTAKIRPEIMILMVQKEVAERICALPPDMNLLGLSVQIYGRPEIISFVSKNKFDPPPQVDSALIKISEISNKFFEKNKINEKKFFEMLKKGFGQKRKKLKNNLRMHARKFASLGIKENARAQELNLNDWIKIYKSIYG